MSGIHTSQPFAILDTTRGLNLDAYGSAQELCQAAMWRTWQDFIMPGTGAEAEQANGDHYESVYARHVAWLRAQVAQIEALHAQTVRRDKHPNSYGDTTDDPDA